MRYEGEIAIKGIESIESYIQQGKSVIIVGDNALGRSIIANRLAERLGKTRTHLINSSALEPTYISMDDIVSAIEGETKVSSNVKYSDIFIINEVTHIDIDMLITPSDRQLVYVMSTELFLYKYMGILQFILKYDVGVIQIEVSGASLFVKDVTLDIRRECSTLIKRIRRKTAFEGEDTAKMHTLYEYQGKMGTTARTKFWFTEIPTIGAVIQGVCSEDSYTPYKAGHSFQYPKWSKFRIRDIGDLYKEGIPFVYASKL